MAAEMSASEENRISRRDFKNGERGRKMIGGTVKSSFLIGQLIVARANEPIETRKPSRRKRSRKGKPMAALILYMNRLTISQKIYMRAMLAVLVLVGLTAISLWHVVHPISHEPIERWQVPATSVQNSDELRTEVVTPTRTTGVAGVSISRSYVAPTLLPSMPPSTTPTPVPSVTTVPVVIQPIACALGPTLLPEGGSFCQHR